MPSLGCAMVVDNTRMLARSIESVRYWVDEIHVMIDRRRMHQVVPLVSALRVSHSIYDWKDDFSDAYNEARRRTRCDWTIILDADEFVPEKTSSQLSSLTSWADADGIPGFNSLQRHWNDLAMTSHSDRFDECWPARLMHKSVKFVGRVHQRTDQLLVNCPALTIDHFALALERPHEREAKCQYYEKLSAMDELSP